MTEGIPEKDVSSASANLRPHGKFAVAAWIFLLIFTGSFVGFMPNYQQSFFNGFSFNLSNALAILAEPILIVLIGPMAVTAWIGFLLTGPGSGLIGIMILLLGSVLQYILLVIAIRRLFRHRDSWHRWTWRGFLIAYSALVAYALTVVISVT